MDEARYGMSSSGFEHHERAAEVGLDHRLG
jgi:hypothetical protein